MGARYKGAFEQAEATGWNSERFAREKRLEPLTKYQDNKPKSADEGAADLRAMIARRLEKQESRRGTG